jgi:hypothetical protein
VNAVLEHEAKKVAELKANPGPRGRFDWDTRAFAPGLDVGAVRLTALSEGLSKPGHDHDMAGPMAEFMAFAFASLHDKAVTATMGLRPWPEADTAEAAAMARVGYAGCVRAVQCGFALLQAHGMLGILRTAIHAELLNPNRARPSLIDPDLLADLDKLLVNIERVKPRPYDGFLVGFATGDPAEDRPDEWLDAGAAVCLACGGYSDKCEACNRTGEVHL